MNSGDDMEDLQLSQTNRQTKEMEKPPDNQNWHYQNEHDQWISYESLVQNSIEKAFQSYRSRQGTSTINIQPPGRSEAYQINSSNGQINNNKN
jgi:hypothetical protein